MFPTSQELIQEKLSRAKTLEELERMQRELFRGY